MRRYLGIGALLAALLAALGGLGFTRPARSAAPAPGPGEKSFRDLLLEAARDYQSYGRIDDEMRWAPYLCRMPMPGIAHVSASKDAETHGRKLYSLFAKNRQEYVGLAGLKTVSVGQVLVKQSWVPEEVPGDKAKGPPWHDVPLQEVVRTPPAPGQRAKGLDGLGDHFWPYAVGKDGKRYKASKLAGLFIMLKLDPKTPGTDAGWLYGTVTPDGKKVTAVGRVESCMKCHQEAKHDRLFGLKP